MIGIFQGFDILQISTFRLCDYAARDISLVAGPVTQCLAEGAVPMVPSHSLMTRIFIACS